MKRGSNQTPRKITSIDFVTENTVYTNVATTTEVIGLVSVALHAEQKKGPKTAVFGLYFC